MKNTHFLHCDKNLMQHIVTIHGIGRQNSLRICDNLGLCPRSLYASYSAAIQESIYFYIQQNFFTENLYRNIVKRDIDRMVEISCYKGIRHSRGLPCRGQRTHGNAKTVRKFRGLDLKKQKSQSPRNKGSKKPSR